MQKYLSAFLILVMVLSLAVGFVATREALDLPTDKTLITVLVGWALVMIVYILLGVAM